MLTIAGSDTSGGAGVQMDLKVFQASGVHGASVLTALTAQSTVGVERVHRVPPRFVAAQIDAVARDLPIAAAKTGMLDRAAIVEIVAERLARRRIPNVVVDPVILAKDGTALLDNRGLEALRKRLLPLATLVTPNVPEAAALARLPITDPASLEEAARRIHALGVQGVMIKGGHLPGAPDDTLLWDGRFYRFPGERIMGPPVHGTGCLYSAAVAARLALGDDPVDACLAAKDRVTRAIAGAVTLGKGSRLAVITDSSNEQW